jgi:hypothetical protein
VDIAKLVAKLELQSSQFQSEIEKTNKKLLGFQKQASSSLKSVERSAIEFGNVLRAGFAVAGFTSLSMAISDVVSRGDELSRLSEQLGSTVESLSQLQYISQKSDVDFKALTTSLNSFSKNLGMAAEDGGRAKEALRDLGIDARRLVSLSLDDQLDVIADAMARIENPTQRTKIAMELFGSAGAGLIPILAQGSDGIRRLREESDALGRTMSTEAAAKLSEADDAMKRMKASADSLANSLVTAVAPAISGLGILLTGVGGNPIVDIDNRIRLLDTQIAGLRSTIVSAAGTHKGDLQRQLGDLMKQRTDLVNAQKEMLGLVAKVDKLSEVNITLRRKNEPIFKDFINPQLMLELEENFSYLENEARNTAEAFAEAFKYEEKVAKQAARGIEDSHSEMSEQLKDHFREVGSVLEDTLDKQTEMSVYAEQAARNMQDHFAEFLFDPFKDGLDGMLKGFIDVIRRMVAEAAAAKIFDYLGGGSDGGWLTSLLGAFGGGKAKGGPLESGKWYIAGEHGPEPIWGGGPGAFAMGYGGGGMVVNVNNTFNNVRDLSDEKMSIYARRISDATIARIRDEDRRGTRR